MKRLTDEQWEYLRSQIAEKNHKIMHLKDRLVWHEFYGECFDQFVEIVEKHVTFMEHLVGICKIAAIIDNERYPGFTERLLTEYYKSTHGDTGER